MGDEGNVSSELQGDKNKGGYGTMRTNPRCVRECALMCSPRRKGAGVPSARVLASVLCQGGEMRVACFPTFSTTNTDS